MPSRSIESCSNSVSRRCVRFQASVSNWRETLDSWNTGYVSGQVRNRRLFSHVIRGDQWFLNCESVNRRMNAEASVITKNIGNKVTEGRDSRLIVYIVQFTLHWIPYRGNKPACRPLIIHRGFTACEQFTGVPSLPSLLLFPFPACNHVKSYEFRVRKYYS